MQDIRRPIECEMARFEELRSQLLKSDNQLLAVALAHVARRAGKMMRPMLTFLMARTLEQPFDRDAVCHASLALELLHTASLVHDDVVDESDKRRGQASLNALFDNRAAVLVGDYILSTSLREGARTGSNSFVDMLGHLCQDLSDGELRQMHNMDETSITEEQYYEVVRRKTASLFATAAAASTCLVAPDADVYASSAYRLGETIGILFQIRDDIFDLTQGQDIGKPTGNDLLEGKLTLPVIRAIQQREHLHEAAMRVRRLESTAADRELLANEARAVGIDYAEGRIAQLQAEAHALVPQADDEITVALHAYIDYAAARNY